MYVPIMCLNIMGTGTPWRLWGQESDSLSPCDHVLGAELAHMRVVDIHAVTQLKIYMILKTCNFKKENGDWKWKVCKQVSDQISLETGWRYSSRVAIEWK